MNDEGFSRTYSVRWADLDPNNQMRHSAYDDYAVDVRLQLMDANGFTQDRFKAIGFGPVILRQEARYYREVTGGETITITVRMAGMSPDGSRWKMQHEVLKASGEKAASITIEGTWLDLITRAAIVPPPELLAITDRLPRTGNFEELRSLVRRKV